MGLKNMVPTSRNNDKKRKLMPAFEKKKHFFKLVIKHIPKYLKYM